MKASIFVREIYRKYEKSGIKRPLLRKLHGEIFWNFDNRVTIAKEDNFDEKEYVIESLFAQWRPQYSWEKSIENMAKVIYSALF